MNLELGNQYYIIVYDNNKEIRIEKMILYKISDKYSYYCFSKNNIDFKPDFVAYNDYALKMRVFDDYYSALINIPVFVSSLLNKKNKLTQL